MHSGRIANGDDELVKPKLDGMKIIRIPDTSSENMCCT
jgi:hypothetical protein